MSKFLKKSIELKSDSSLLYVDNKQRDLFEIIISI